MNSLYSDTTPKEAIASQLPRTTSTNSNNSNNSTQSNTSVTFAAQQNLPRLPIPDLEVTMRKFPAVLAGIQDEEQQAETKRVALEFLQGPGPILQQALIDYERQGFESGDLGSYVEEFWNESYLAPDASVVLNLNPYFCLSDLPDPKTAKDPLRCAASLAFSSIKIASLLKHEALPPDVFRGKPLCMDQFRALLGSSRVAKRNCDEVNVYPDSQHVIVLCKNQFYSFAALWPSTGHVAVDEEDVLEILRAIELHASQTLPEEASRNAIGVLTSAARSEWADARNELELNPKNAAALHIIDSALFVLVLDDFVPPNIHAAGANMLHGTSLLNEDNLQVGTCLNRWYDKLQLIVCKDGTSGINFEHSTIDGHTALRFVSDMYAETIITFAETIVDLIHGRGRIQHIVEATIRRAATATNGEVLDVLPKKILFEVSERMQERIYFAETSLCDDVVSTDTFVLEFTGFGMALMKKNNFSPDSFVQMSIMLAYYKLYGKLVCTYEPVLTKMFYHGRTEAMRSATPQVRELCEIWCRKSSTTREKLQALRVATIEHARLVKDCAIGMGVDRHLFALKCIAERKDMAMPAFFQSQAWSMLNHTILSTSNCGNPALRLFGFGPVVPDGFGIGYIIKDHGVSYSVSSKHRQTLRYVHCLEATLKAMQELLTPMSNVRVEPRTSLRHIGEYMQQQPPSPAQTSYDDVYGETSSYIPRSPNKLSEQVIHEHAVGVGDGELDLSNGDNQGSNSTPGRPRLERRTSKQFRRVQTRTRSLDFLTDPNVQVALDFVAGEQGGHYEESTI
ncbi:hypothetical protein MPSEU_000943300 [Mayamaea pseudoterrestris]|nr:hypothetical protein MPSEU_000943300 [Mayamaea pseudoterrestris]